MPASSSRPRRRDSLKHPLPPSKLEELREIISGFIESEYSYIYQLQRIYEFKEDQRMKGHQTVDFFGPVEELIVFHTEYVLEPLTDCKSHAKFGMRFHQTFEQMVPVYECFFDNYERRRNLLRHLVGYNSSFAKWHNEVVKSEPFQKDRERLCQIIDRKNAELTKLTSEQNQCQNCNNCDDQFSARCKRRAEELNELLQLEINELEEEIGYHQTQLKQLDKNSCDLAGLGLPELLCKPFQHVSQYQKLLRDILHLTNPDSTTWDLLYRSWECANSLWKVQELRNELNSERNEAKRRNILKRIIANMSMGTDMSLMLPDVLSCITPSSSLSTRKLVSLFVVNYARFKQEVADSSILLFTKDLSNPNPLVRALSIRTMGYMNVDRLLTAMPDTVLKALKDGDPFVRKTAAMGVLKLFVHDKALYDSNNLLDSLLMLLSDTSPSVLANAAAALLEISERSNDFQLVVSDSAANLLADSLGAASEWGQAYMLEALVYYTPQKAGDAERLCEKIIPRLQHSNSAVVLGAVKAILYLVDYMPNENDVKAFTKKLASPLITLLAKGFEIQYVILRNILLVIQRYQIFDGEMNIFFCKYNDPIYIKTTKLDIILHLTNENNAHQVLSELKEYAAEVDVEFARKAVRSIGVVALRVEPYASECVTALIELTKTRVNYVVQESIIVMRDIFRRYPSKYESTITILCENLQEEVSEPEAKAAIIWILGEYSDRIDNVDEMLDGFLENFPDEPRPVKLALLTTIVKLFLKRPVIGQNLVWKVLKYATEMSDDPDLRDRGYIYWRMLSCDPQLAKTIVTSEKPMISTEAAANTMDPPLLDELLLHISSLSSVYHKPPGAFVAGAKYRGLKSSKVLQATKTSLPLDHYNSSSRYEEINGGDLIAMGDNRDDFQGYGEELELFS